MADEEVAKKDPSGLDIAAGDAEVAREALLKAHFFTAGDRPAGQAIQTNEFEEAAYGRAGAIDPPYNPGTLVALLEHSNALRQCVDAYSTNIDAFGYTLEPIIDLDSSTANDRIKNYLLSRRQRDQAGEVANPTTQVTPPTDEEVAAASAELRERMLAEKVRLTQFFEFCSLDMSFPTLRRQTRADVETTGNGYWEVVRDGSGAVAQFNPVSSFSVRLLPLDKLPTEVKMPIKENEFDYTSINVRKFFRPVVQAFEQRVVFFKEFGDPRCMSAVNGRYFASKAEMLQHDEKDIEATELIHFKVHSSRSAYGIPRWIGTLLSVLGSRNAEEVNYLYFENKSVPPLALLVSGGRIAGDTVNRIKDFIQNEVKGKGNFHKLLVIEAEAGASQGSMDSSGRMRIDLKPLTAAQHNDALFQNYDERNIDKIGQSFRLPRMLRGDIRDFNRGTAEAALDFAESQVFGPERDEFDFLINRKILPVLGIRFWTFKSKAANTRNAKDLVDMIEKLGKALTPAEQRMLAAQAFGREFQRIDAPWTRQPVDLTVAGVVPPDELMAPGMKGPNTPPPELPFAEKNMPGMKQPAQNMRFWRLPVNMSQNDLLYEALRLITLRKALADAEAADAEEASKHPAHAAE